MANMDVSVEMIGPGNDAAAEVVLSVDFKWRPGSPAHMGSLSYAGHPADPPELEVETIFWPIQRWDAEKREFVADHTEMPYGGIPTSIAEAIEAYIIEHYDDSGDEYDD